MQNTTNDDKFHLTFVIGHSSCLFLNDTCNQTWRHISYYWPCNKYMQYVKLSFSCFANMTPVIKIYMTYYDVICHLSWSCRMVYVFHLLLQTWQSQSTQTLLTTWHLSFINVFCNMPFLSFSSVATTALANNVKIINKRSQKKSQCSATCNCPLLCSAGVTHNESWQPTVVICHFSFLLRDVICLVVVLYMTSTAKWTHVNERY